MRPTTLPNTAEEEAREPSMATDELLQEQRKSAGVGLSSSMPALRRHDDAGRAAGRTAVTPFGSSLRCRTRSRLGARKRRGHLPREPISLGAIGFCYRDFHQMSDDEVTNLLGRALRPIERDRAWWMT